MARKFIGGRWLALAASLVVSAAMFHAQGRKEPAVEVAGLAADTPTMVATPASAEPVAEVPEVATREQASLLMARAPQAAPDFEFPLSAGDAPEEGLQVHTIWLARAISMMFLEIDTIGGYRQDPLPWHPNGLAIDVMIPNHDTPEGIELGNQIAGFALANAKRFGVLHVIWRQGLYPGIGAPSWTADYGSVTANHFDHVHIATDGGGYPTGSETYFLRSMEAN